MVGTQLLKKVEKRCVLVNDSTGNIPGNWQNSATHFGLLKTVCGALKSFLTDEGT